MYSELCKNVVICLLCNSTTEKKKLVQFDHKRGTYCYKRRGTQCNRPLLRLVNTFVFRTNKMPSPQTTTRTFRWTQTALRCPQHGPDIHMAFLLPGCQLLTPSPPQPPGPQTKPQPSLNLFQCLTGARRLGPGDPRARGPCDTWPLTGCVADPWGYAATMEGTCRGPVTMVTMDLWGRGGRGGSRVGWSLSGCPGWSMLTICCQLTLVGATL